MASFDWRDAVGLGAGALDWWQIDQTFDDARDDINDATQQGRQDIKTYQQPYQDFGLESIENYQNIDPFSYDYDQFMNSQFVDDTLDRGMDNVLRTNTAQRGLNTGGTLKDLTDYTQSTIGQFYGDDWDRQYQAWEGEVDRNKFGVELGAKVGMNMGDNLADLAMANGFSMASLAASESKAISNVISAATDAITRGDGPGQGGIIDQAIQGVMEAAGIGWNAAKDFVMGAAGAGGANVATDVPGVLDDIIPGSGGGLGTGLTNTTMQVMNDLASMGTNIGAVEGANALITLHPELGVEQATMLAEQLEGFGVEAYKMTSDALASGTPVELAGVDAGTASTATFGSWAASVAAGFGILFGFRAFVDNVLSGTDPMIGQLKSLAKSDDPISNINQMPDKDLRYVGKMGNGDGTTPAAAKGIVYASVINSMEDPRSIKYHPESGTVLKSLLAALTTDSSGSYDLGLGGKASDPVQALIKLFPNQAESIQQYADYHRGFSTTNTMATTYDNAENMMGYMLAQQSVDAGPGNFRQFLNSRIDRWETQSEARTALNNLGGTS